MKLRVMRNKTVFTSSSVSIFAENAIMALSWSIYRDCWLSWSASYCINYVRIIWRKFLNNCLRETHKHELKTWNTWKNYMKFIFLILLCWKLNKKYVCITVMQKLKFLHNFDAGWKLHGIYIFKFYFLLKIE